MSLRAVIELGRKTHKTIWGQTVDSVHSVEHRLSINPFRLLLRHDLPEDYELEAWEGENDGWFRKDGVIYNVNEFCTVGMPTIPGPHGGAQMASNGYFAIAVYEGEIYSVTSKESKPVGYDQIK